MNLLNRTALITGAARRVGRAIALSLADAGGDVAVHYHSAHDEALATAQEIRCRGRRALVIGADLNDAESWPRLVSETAEHFGRLDVLVNNASVFERAPVDSLEAFDAAFWERTLRVNLTAGVALCRHAAVLLAADGGGKVINICDIAAERPWRTHPAYCASKAGLVAATKTLARALAPEIQVNAVAPGIAAFPDHYDDDMRRRLVAKVPLGRAGTAEDIASAVRWLAESADYVTGQIINVDGGRSIV